MWTVVGAAIVGAIAMGRTKPKTGVFKTTMLGPKSGAQYQVEDFRTAGFLVVRTADGATGVFERRAITEPGAPGFRFKHGTGHPQAIATMKLDLCHPDEIAREKKRSERERERREEP